MRQKSAKDRVIARAAERQHGVVSTRQLLAAGIDSSGIRRRKHAGRLHSIHRGVYAVGHRALGLEGRWMAAVLACGEGAVLSHRSAAALWQLLPTTNGVVVVSVPAIGGRRKRPGIRIYRSSTLNARHLTRQHVIPVTTPARTIADLRRDASVKVVRRAIRQAAVLGLDVGDAEPDFTRSELEYQFIRLCRRQRLPPPEVNAKIGRFVVDFLWRDRAVIAETDGYRYHRGRQVFEEDRARDVELRMHGFEVVRFTYRQVTEDPGGVAAALGTILASRAGLSPSQP